MLQALLHNHFQTAAVILSAIGLTNLLLQRNMIRKIIGLNIMDTAVYLFLASQGTVTGRAAPVIVNGVTSAEAYVNPIPAGLVLTGIVVSVSVTAFALSMTLRMYEQCGTLNIDEALVPLAHAAEDDMQPEDLEI